MLIEGLPLWLAQTNAWLVAPDGPGGECVLIDAPPDPAKIVERLEHHGLKLVALFNTHGHIDHIGGVGSLVHGLEGGSAIEVRIHDDDKHMLLDPDGHQRHVRLVPRGARSPAARGHLRAWTTASRCAAPA